MFLKCIVIIVHIVYVFYCLPLAPFPDAALGGRQEVVEGLLITIMIIIIIVILILILILTMIIIIVIVI